MSMKQFVVYNADGSIVKSGACPADDINDQYSSPQLLLEVTDATNIDDTCCYVDVTVTPNVVVFLTPTSDYDVLNMTTKQMEKDQSLEDANSRMQRDTLLSASDWTQMPDSPLSSSDKTAWATYRQELRDWPGTNDFPDLSTLPSEPT